LLDGAADQGLDFVLAADVAGNDDRLAARFLDSGDNFLAGVRLATGNNHLGTERSHDLGGRAADAAAGPCNDSHLAGEIERVLHGVNGLPVLCVNLVAKAEIRA